jgi:hypothetical protein
MLSAASASASRPHASVNSRVGAYWRCMRKADEKGGLSLRYLGLPCRMFVFEEKAARTLVCEATERVNACTRTVLERHAH